MTRPIQARFLSSDFIRSAIHDFERRAEKHVLLGRSKGVIYPVTLGQLGWVSLPSAHA